MSPIEHKILQEAMEDILQKSLIQESKSPCAIHTFLVPKKDSTMKMHAESYQQDHNKYKFPTPKLEDMLDMFKGAQIFSKLDLRSGYYQTRIRQGDG